MNNMGLRSRLFLSHLLVMIFSLSCYIVINRYAAFRYFADHLEDLVLNQTEILPLKDVLIEGFAIAWHASAGWSIFTGAIVALLLSYWVAKRITTPLINMEHTTQAFASGNLEARIPASSIPEINRLGRSFNRMALSLEQVEQKRQEMIGDLAHELRTPLTILRGYLEELADERIAPTPLLFNQLQNRVRRLERLVADLQTLSKAETGHLPLHFQAVDLARLLRQVQEVFATQLDENSPRLVVNIPPALPLAWADPDRTEQILLNLMGNALRYTTQGCISVSPSLQQDRLWIDISDTGPGIAPEDLPHVFDRFWRSPQAQQTHSQGSGLGLAITRRLVELQGGTLTVQSQLGQGSTFRVSLPLADRHRP
ncbi:sensor histidine kinase [Lyngbya confervoides]|uniref:histidine kinase n=1 Tax=Lyngbya confervoides BDU141951 TaxID=1574623 RepID=A0ABD4T071_9CYAN|nr:HAMP domain-containing sensor histidine kinase [Lyngbya confervoides]MCM1981923.1 HAMP domain-containing histidine kinase [Lyngbya confervoides BDU141951]